MLRLQASDVKLGGVVDPEFRLSQAAILHAKWNHLLRYCDGPIQRAGTIVTIQALSGLHHYHVRHKLFRILICKNKRQEFSERDLPLLHCQGYIPAIRLLRWIIGCLEKHQIRCRIERAPWSAHGAQAKLRPQRLKQELLYLEQMWSAVAEVAEIIEGDSSRSPLGGDPHRLSPE